MEVKVVPFVPVVTNVNPANAAANELQSLINQMLEEGWEFVNLSSMQTSIKQIGCNSSGSGPVVNIQLLIFKK